MKRMLIVDTLHTPACGDRITHTIANNLPEHNRNYEFGNSYGQLQTRAEQNVSSVRCGTDFDEAALRATYFKKARCFLGKVFFKPCGSTIPRSLNELARLFGPPVNVATVNLRQTNAVVEIDVTHLSPWECCQCPAIDQPMSCSTSADDGFENGAEQEKTSVAHGSGIAHNRT